MSEIKVECLSSDKTRKYIINLQYIQPSIYWKVVYVSSFDIQNPTHFPGYSFEVKDGRVIWQENNQAIIDEILYLTPDIKQWIEERVFSFCQLHAFW